MTMCSNGRGWTSWFRVWDSVRTPTTTAVPRTGEISIVITAEIKDFGSVVNVDRPAHLPKPLDRSEETPTRAADA
jgi:hypothetical protein